MLLSSSKSSKVIMHYSVRPRILLWSPSIWSMVWHIKIFSWPSYQLVNLMFISSTHIWIIHHSCSRESSSVSSASASSTAIHLILHPLSHKLSFLLIQKLVENHGVVIIQSLMIFLWLLLWRSIRLWNSLLRTKLLLLRNLLLYWNASSRFLFYHPRHVTYQFSSSWLPLRHWICYRCWFTSIIDNSCLSTRPYWLLFFFNFRLRSHSSRNARSSHSWLLFVNVRFIHHIWRHCLVGKHMSLSRCCRLFPCILRALFEIVEVFKTMHLLIVSISLLSLLSLFISFGFLC